MHDPFHCYDKSCPSTSNLQCNATACCSNLSKNDNETWLNHYVTMWCTLKPDGGQAARQTYTRADIPGFGSRTFTCAKASCETFQHAGDFAQNSLPTIHKILSARCYHRHYLTNTTVPEPNKRLPLLKLKACRNLNAMRLQAESGCKCLASPLLNPSRPNPYTLHLIYVVTQTPAYSTFSPLPLAKIGHLAALLSAAHQSQLRERVRLFGNFWER